MSWPACGVACAGVMSCNAARRLLSASIRKLPSTTTRSPSCKPSNTSTRSPLRWPVAIGRGAKRPVATSTSAIWRSPESISAERGMVSPSRPSSPASATLPNRPGRSRPSGFGNATRTASVRLAASSTGCRKLTLPSNDWPASAGEVKRAGWPSRTWPICAAGTFTVTHTMDRSASRSRVSPATKRVPCTTGFSTITPLAGAVMARLPGGRWAMCSSWSAPMPQFSRRRLAASRRRCIDCRLAASPPRS